VLKIVNGDMIILKHPTDWKIKCGLQLAEGVAIPTDAGHPTDWKIKCGLQPLYYMENDKRKDLSHLQECKLHKAYDMICHNMYRQEHASKTADIYAEFRSETTKKTLKEMADAV